MLGTQDLLVGLVLAAFFFGAKRLPEIARSLGQSMSEFKKAVSGDDNSRDGPESAAPAVPAVPPSAPPGSRTCAGCGATLDTAWNHCPRCGAVAPRSGSSDSPL